MYLNRLRVRGLRCFDDTRDLRLGKAATIIVGTNNSGKSTLLKAVESLQGGAFHIDDLRFDASERSVEVGVVDTDLNYLQDGFGFKSPAIFRRSSVATNFSGDKDDDGLDRFTRGELTRFFKGLHPMNFIVPFAASRNMSAYSEDVTLRAASIVDGTYSNLYSRIDALAGIGHPRNPEFSDLCNTIIGLRISTTASENGKVGGHAIPGGRFVPLPLMGAGIAEMTALIAELCLARGKLFLLEEPERNLHPAALKKLLNAVRDASKANQFIVSTHSNIVLRELGALSDCEIIRVARTGPDSSQPSVAVNLPRDSSTHRDLLTELGYEFSDFGLHEAWLFLEESSAEEIIRDFIIPIFVPKLMGRLRTFSAGGVDNVEPRIEDFRKLLVFVHLQPIYRGRLWVKVDGDDSGQRVVHRLLQTFKDLNRETCSMFKEAAFERYYPEHFQIAVEEALASTDTENRRQLKARLLKEVKEWMLHNPDLARIEFQKSAWEIVEYLNRILRSLVSK